LAFVAALKSSFDRREKKLEGEGLARASGTVREGGAFRI